MSSPSHLPGAPPKKEKIVTSFYSLLKMTFHAPFLVSVNTPWEGGLSNWQGSGGLLVVLSVNPCSQTSVSHLWWAESSVRFWVETGNGKVGVLDHIMLEVQTAFVASHEEGRLMWWLPGMECTLLMNMLPLFRLWGWISVPQALVLWLDSQGPFCHTLHYESPEMGHESA